MKRVQPEVHEVLQDSTESPAERRQTVSIAHSTNSSEKHEVPGWKVLTWSRKEKEIWFLSKEIWFLFNEGLCGERKREKKIENRLIMFSKDFWDVFIFMCKSNCLCVCVCTTCLLGALRGQKRALDAQRLEFGMVVKHHVKSGN